MKVLQVIPSVAPSYGGPAHLIRVFFKLLNESPNCHTDIVSTSSPGETITDLPQPESKPLSLEQSAPLLFSFAKQKTGSSWCYSKSLRRWLESNLKYYDVVHIHGLFAYPGLIAAKLCRKLNIPYVVSPMGMLDPWPFQHKYLKKKIFYELFEKRTLKNAAVIHATALPEKNNILGFLPRAHVNIVPLSVDHPAVEALVAADGACTEILFMSRLDEKKGLPNLLEAVALLKDQGVRVRLRIAGTGDQQYSAYLQQKVHSLGIADWVEFLGFVGGEQKEQIFASSQLFVLPSYHENFGIVVAEALSYGLPVITTDSVALIDAIEEFDAGCRVPIDNPAAIVAAIKSLSSNTRWQTCSDNAKNLAQTYYSHAQLVNALMTLYQQVITIEAAAESL